MRKCELCGVEIEGHPNKKQCDECRKKENIKHRENWRKEHPFTKEELREFQKKHYKDNPKKFEEKRRNYSESNRDKIKIWNDSKRVLRGQFCYFCGSEENLVRHHPDYSNPERIITLCKSCHTKIHLICPKEQSGLESVKEIESAPAPADTRQKCKHGVYADVCGSCNSSPHSSNGLEHRPDVAKVGGSSPSGDTNEQQIKSELLDGLEEIK